MKNEKYKYTKKRKEIEIKEKDFFHKDVNLFSSVFFPEGYETLVGIIYFSFIPYLTGLVFIFGVLSFLKLDMFKFLIGDNSFFVTWLTGYEILALIILLIIFKLGFSSLKKTNTNKNSVINKKSAFTYIK